MAEDPRFDYLEGRVDEQSRNWDRIYHQIGTLDTKVSAKIEALEQKLGTRIDAFAQTLNAKIDDKIDGLDQKFDRKFDDLRAELSRQFRWTIGLMITLGGGLAALILQ